MTQQPPTPGAAVLTWTPTRHELDDARVLLLGGYGPVPGFVDPARGGPAGPSLTLPAGSSPGGLHRGDGVLLTDEEGAPVALVEVTDTRELPGGGTAVSGPVRSPRGAAVPARDAADWAVEVGPGPVLAVPVVSPLHEPDVAAVRSAARASGARVLLLVLTGAGSSTVVSPAALVRCCRAVAHSLDAVVAPVPVPHHPDPGLHDALVAMAARAHGGTLLPAPGPGAQATGAAARVELPRMVQDAGSLAWGPATEIVAADRVPWSGDPAEVIAAAWAAGRPVPAGATRAPVARELRRARPGRGAAVMFTGLSGSGKSTLAAGVAEQLAARTDRTLTVLDGDIVRRMLSSELDFSRPHRELNVRRIGYVAAEVARHGGLALCAPIAPFAAGRAEVRSMVSEHGQFFLVHVATPLQECERRDRKGLYARARAGQVAEFTGISSPYELPEDADLVVDTSTRDVAECVQEVVHALVDRGLVVLSDNGWEG